MTKSEDCRLGRSSSLSAVQPDVDVSLIVLSVSSLVVGGRQKQAYSLYIQSSQMIISVNDCQSVEI
jgi:hypothetical protein